MRGRSLSHHPPLLRLESKDFWRQPEVRYSYQLFILPWFITVLHHLKARQVRTAMYSLSCFIGILDVLSSFTFAVSPISTVLRLYNHLSTSFSFAMLQAKIASHNRYSPRAYISEKDSVEFWCTCTHTYHMLRCCLSKTDRLKFENF